VHTQVAIAGHSIGEYVAACFAGVLTLPDALALVAKRGALTENESPPGAMLSVGMGGEALAAFLAAWNSEAATAADELTLAADNAPELKVLSGSEGTVAAALTALGARVPAVRATVLHVNRAFHSPFMRTPAAALVAAAKDVALRLPTLPMASNVTGEWITEDDLSAEYWGRHMAGAVRWRENARCLLRWKPFAVLEVGPGGTLCKLTAKCAAPPPTSAEASAAPGVMPLLLQTMRHPRAGEFYLPLHFTRFMLTI
jgi:acyl transferase domain-containing protein